MGKVQTTHKVSYCIFVIISTILFLGRIVIARTTYTIEVEVIQNQMWLRILYFFSTIISFNAIIRKSVRPHIFLALILLIPLIVDFLYLLPINHFTSIRVLGVLSIEQINLYIRLICLILSLLIGNHSKKIEIVK